MAIFLKKFENHTQYEQYINSGDAILPNVSICTTEDDVHYNPNTPPPTPITRDLVCTYVPSPSGSGSGSGSGEGGNSTQLFSSEFIESIESMTIDGNEQSSIVNSYDFRDTSEHTVVFTLKEDDTSLLNDVFRDCYNLTSVIIPNSVTSIGDYAFYNCTGLTSVTIPDSVTSIGSTVFNYTPWWYTYSADTSHHYDNIIYINDVAYKAISKGITSVTFKSGTVSICGSAFYGCSGLTSVTIPNSVTSIGNYAFMYCTSLTSVTIPNSVTSIGENAFYGCSGLTSIIINAPTPPTLVDASAFNDTNNCPIYVPSASVETYKSASGWSSYASRIQAMP